MILGRGTAQTTEEIMADYQHFLMNDGNTYTEGRLQRLQHAPLNCWNRRPLPIRAWSEDDILHIFQPRGRRATAEDLTFLTFLFFRGYVRPTLPLLVTLDLRLTQHWRRWSVPYQDRIAQSRKALDYRAVSEPIDSRVLRLLIWLLVITGKTLDELTREVVDQFAAGYQHWYQTARIHQGAPDAHLYRLECYLVHWKVIPPAVKKPLLYEQKIDMLRCKLFQSVLLRYFKWCELKLSSATARGIRTLLLPFFLWLQEQYPAVDRLDHISRQIALAYLEHLKEQVENGRYGIKHQHGLYHTVRRFLDTAMDEPFETAPGRNPFLPRDFSRLPETLPRYFSDAQLQTILTYCEQEASLFEQTLIITLLHTGIRSKEFVRLQASHLVQIGGTWKLHIHEGKGLKDRMIPLTPRCLEVLQAWQKKGWDKQCDALFSHFGRPWTTTGTVRETLHTLGRKLDIPHLTAHRFRHTFAVALLNYGLRESALQKLMGHATLDMTLEYARILDQTVEQAFAQAVEHMQEGSHSWVPNFFVQEEYTIFVEGDAVSWIRLPLGYCRRNPKLHCESDVKCLLCERFAVGGEDLPRLKLMYERFIKLGLKVKADVVAAQIQRLALPSGEAPDGFIPASAIAVARRRQ